MTAFGRFLSSVKVRCGSEVVVRIRQLSILIPVHSDVLLFSERVQHTLEM